MVVSHVLKKLATFLELQITFMTSAQWKIEHGGRYREIVAIYSLS